MFFTGLLNRFVCVSQLKNFFQFPSTLTSIVNQRKTFLMRSIFCNPFLAAAAVALNLSAVQCTFAQVNGPGPSDSSMFDTVLDFTPSTNVPSDSSSGGDPSTTTQLNASIGTIGNNFNANVGSEINLSGDVSVGDGFNANSGSEINVSGGTLGDRFVANAGSVFSVSGGTLGGAGELQGGTVDVTGGLVRDGFTIDSGVLNVDGGNIGRVRLGGGIVNLSAGSIAGGLGDSGISGGTLNITGGTLGSRVNLIGGTVNLSEGVLGAAADAFAGSTLNISGGRVGNIFSAEVGSTVNISGGSIGSNFQASEGSNVQLIGGDFRLNGNVVDGTSVSLAPRDVLTGTLQNGSAFIFAEDNGDQLANVTLTPSPLPAFETTPIVISTPGPNVPTGLRSGQTLTVLQGGSLGQSFEAVDATLNIQGGVLGDDAELARSSISITEGGTTGARVSVFSSDVVIDGGSTGTDFEIYTGSTVNLVDGTIGLSSSIGSNGTLTVNGGTVERDFTVNDDGILILNSGLVDTGLEAANGAEVIVNGGTIGSEFFASGEETFIEVNGGILRRLRVQNGATIDVNGADEAVGTFDLIIERGSTLNLRGGGISDRFSFREDVNVNIFGTEFFLDDERLELSPDELFVLDRDLGGVLTSTLLDGSINQLDLDSYRLSDGTVVSVSLAVGVPEPSSSALLLLAFVGLLAPRRR